MVGFGDGKGREEDDQGLQMKISRPEVRSDRTTIDGEEEKCNAKVQKNTKMRGGGEEREEVRRRRVHEIRRKGKVENRPHDWLLQPARGGKREWLRRRIGPAHVPSGQRPASLTEAPEPAPPHYLSELWYRK